MYIIFYQLIGKRQTDEIKNYNISIRKENQMANKIEEMLK